MRPTRLGIKAIVFYELLICAFFAAPYLNLFFLLLAFCSVLAVLNLYWTDRNIAGISGSLVDLRPMPAGAEQTGHATLTCNRRDRFDLSLEITIEGKTGSIAHHLQLTPGHEQRFDVVLPQLTRGVHAIGTVRVSTIFPFGTVSARRRITSPATVIVYPAPADLAQYRDRNGIGGLSGLGGSNAQDMTPAGLREYREGDEMRNVHWKASARRRNLIVKEFECDSTPGLEVVLDLRARGDSFEETLSLVSALVLECEENKELFTLHTQDHSDTYGKGHRSLDRLLTYLAEVQPLREDAPAPPQVSPTVLRLPLPELGDRSSTSQRMPGSELHRQREART